MKRSITSFAFLAAFTHGQVVLADFPKLELPRLGIFRKKQDPPATAPAKPAPTPTPETPANPTEQLAAKNGAKTALETLKSDIEEKRRVAAAEFLRTTDPRLNADVIPTLTNSLQQDPSALVRASVAESLGRLKPTSQSAGAVLEQTVAADPSEAVRKAAQQALWQYHLNGYRSSSANAAIPQTAEPPLAKPKPAPAKPNATGTTVSKQSAGTAEPAPSLRPITTGIGKGAIYPQTVEPPLAKEKVDGTTVERMVPKPEVKPPLPSIVVPPISFESPVEKKDEPKNRETATTPLPSVAVPLPPASAPLVPSIPPPPSESTLPVIPKVPSPVNK
jgi:HEAT repeats